MSYMCYMIKEENPQNANIFQNNLLLACFILL